MTRRPAHTLSAGSAALFTNDVSRKRPPESVSVRSMRDVPNTHLASGKRAVSARTYASPPTTAAVAAADTVMVAATSIEMFISVFLSPGMRAAVHCSTVTDHHGKEYQHSPPPHCHATTRGSPVHVVAALTVCQYHEGECPNRESRMKVRAATAMFIRIAGIGLTIAAILVPATEAQDQPPVRDLTFFLRRLRTVDHMPELEASHTAMSSTWDRTGGNGDGTDFKNIVKPTTDSLGRNILLDTAGPGCIHRIFVGVLGEQQAETRIQIFLDHSAEPLIDMPILDFFSDSNGPFPYPLVFHKSYPGMLFPIPFEKHCLVQLVNNRFGKPDWNDAAWSNYWQIVHTRYPDSLNVKSLTWPLNETEKKETDATVQAWLEAETQPPAEPAKWSIDQTAALEPGKAAHVDLSDAGTVRQMQISVEPATPEVLRGTRLQIRWDGAAEPSVNVPIGHFFGHAYSGHGKWFTSKAAVLGRHPLKDAPYVDYHSAYNSLLLGVTETEAYCRFPMPFSQGAKLSIANQSGKRIENLRVRLDVERIEQIPANWGRFHATWTEALAATDLTPAFGPQKVPGKVVLQKEGRGKYVGVMLTVDWPYESGYWWGEGDWMIWTDENDWPPSYHGTGSEEYFNSGWCQFDRKAVSGFVTLRPGHPTVYTLHLNDAFQFQQNVRVVEEQMGYGPGEMVIRTRHPLWTSTAFWYATPAQSAGSD